MSKVKANVIIPTDLVDPIESHEIEAAWILARHYNVIVEFLKPIDGYKVKTADFVMDGIIWELKSPIGKSKNTIEYALRRAGKQSRFLVFDGRRALLSDEFMVQKIHYELSKRRSIKKVIFINKNQEVLEILT